MKRTIPVYLRIARHHRFQGGFKVDVSMRPNHSPLKAGTPGYDEVAPTRLVKLRLRFDDEMFLPPEVLQGEVELNPDGTVDLAVEQVPIP